MWNRLAHMVVANHTHHEAANTSTIQVMRVDGRTWTTAMLKIRMAATKMRS